MMTTFLPTVEQGPYLVLFGQRGPFYGWSQFCKFLSMNAIFLFHLCNIKDFEIVLILESCSIGSAGNTELLFQTPRNMNGSHNKIKSSSLLADGPHS